jgi:hypothetical protein
VPVVVGALDVQVSEVKQEFHDFEEEGALRGCLRGRAIGSRLLLLRGDTGLEKSVVRKYRLRSGGWPLPIV